MTADEILSGITEPIENRNEVAAVLFLFQTVKTEQHLMRIGKNLAEEKHLWNEGDLAILRKHFYVHLDKLKEQNA